MRSLPWRRPPRCGKGDTGIELEIRVRGIPSYDNAKKRKIRESTRNNEFQRQRWTLKPLQHKLGLLWHCNSRHPWLCHHMENLKHSAVVLNFIKGPSFVQQITPSEAERLWHGVENCYGGHRSEKLWSMTRAWNLSLSSPKRQRILEGFRNGT